MTIGRRLQLSGPIRAQIATVPDRENVVWELWVDRYQIAEVAIEGGELSVEIFMPQGLRGLRVSLNEILTELSNAKEDLTKAYGLGRDVEKRP